MEFFHQTTYHDSEEFPMVAQKIHDLEFSPHWHSDVEFIFIRSGSLGITVNEDSKIVGPGSLIVCGGLDVHSYRRVSSKTETIMVMFRPSIVQELNGWPNSGRLLSNIALRGEHSEFSQKVERMMLSILDEMTAKRPGYQTVAKGLALELCGLTARELSVGAVLPEEERGLSDLLKRMQAAIDFIRERFRYPITLEDVAAAASLSPWYFSRMFKKTIGVSFRSYVNEARIEYAEKLMTDSKKNLADIALECGFDNLRTFNRAFQAARAMTPSEARSRLA